MRFGDYIRDLRRERQWTQPEAAQKIGIEQSYLSKLESGKSYPSEDIFSAIKTAYGLDLADLNATLFPGEVDRLRDIAEVRAVVLERTQAYARRVQIWLYAGIGALVLGGALLGLVQLGQDSTVAKFQYRSVGVVLEGEGFDVFEIIGDGPFDGRPDAEVLNQRQQIMISRIDEQYQSITDYRGVVFYDSVPGGTRVWRFFGSSTDTQKSPLRWLLVPALMSLLGAFGCFFASYRSRAI